MGIIPFVPLLGLGAEAAPNPALDRLLNPVYTGLTRTALTEAENRYGPYLVGTLIGLFLFNLYLGRQVLG